MQIDPLITMMTKAILIRKYRTNFFSFGAKLLTRNTENYTTIKLIPNIEHPKTGKCKEKTHQHY